MCMGKSVLGLPPAAVRDIARADWIAAAEVYDTYHPREARQADEAARALMHLMATADDIVPSMAMANAILRLAECGWERPDEADRPALRLAAAAMEAQARGGALDDGMRLAVWLQAASLHAAAGDLVEACTCVPSAQAVAVRGDLGRMATVMCAMDPSLASEIAAALPTSGARPAFVRRFMDDLSAAVAGTGDWDEVRGVFDALVVASGEFAIEVARGARMGLAWRMPG